MKEVVTMGAEIKPGDLVMWSSLWIVIGFLPDEPDAYNKPSTKRRAVILGKTLLFDYDFDVYASYTVLK